MMGEQKCDTEFIDCTSRSIESTVEEEEVEGEEGNERRTKERGEGK